MKAVTADIMREIDQVSIEDFSIPAVVLMNNAGKAVADFAIKNSNSRFFDIFCGTGNNGGDGFTAAYYLKNYGADPVIYIAGVREKISPASLVFLVICENLGIPIIYVDDKNVDSLCVRTGSLVIDSLTGTGFEGVLRGIPLQLVNLINNSSSKVLSVDIPSGLPSDGHAPEGAVVSSNYTVTMGLPKISLVTYPGKEYCGNLHVADIGFPPELTKNEKLKIDLIDAELLREIKYTGGSDDIHKGDKGSTLIIGGVKGMEGAALLTASAMFRAGTGLVTVATVKESREIIAGKIPELMTISLPVTPDKDFADAILLTKKYTSFIIGPGLGRDKYAEDIFSLFLERGADAGIKKIIIDGDGLFHLASYLKHKRIPSGIDCIITPHFMEASRFIGESIDKIRNNRLNACVKLAQSTGCITVLKGPGTIISDGVNSFINTTGNKALATAGSGDVLSGIIGAFFHKISDPISAAFTGVYIHGLCAELYSETNPRDSMNSSDILDYIRPSLAKIPS